MSKRILLSSVFGPYGVDDAYGRKENVMELFHNQVTRAQGLASLRFHHRSFGLYWLAENVKAPVTVLDFPTEKQFVALLEKERFDAVGISFIAPNFKKAQRMARLVRELQPNAEVILGGHGTAIEDVERSIDCDHVVRGEGLRWLRRYLGEDVNAPLRHPTLVSAEHKRIFGLPTPGIAGLLIPGVGCVNGCRFCSTTHFFGDYVCYFPTGEALYREVCRLSEALGTDEFFVMDENFLKQTERARELLECMVRDDRHFRFMVFSSAEAIAAFGIENLARLGVTFLWLGAESKREVYAKNQGLDLKALVKALRDHGIFVLVSGILFLEHHTHENIQEDVDFLIEVGGVFTQFMMFTPMPQTRLYREYKEQGRIDFDVPYEEWHGQHLLNFRHPHFTPEESTRVLDRAFEQEYDELSASVVRMLDTALRGYRTMREKALVEPWFEGRVRQMQAQVEELRLIVPVMRRFAHNELERQRIDAAEHECTALFGPVPAPKRLTQLLGRVVAELHAARESLFGYMPQPTTHLTRYRWVLSKQPRALAGARPKRPLPLLAADAQGPSLQ